MSKPKKIKNKKRPRPVEYHVCNGSIGFHFYHQEQDVTVHLHSRFKGEEELDDLYDKSRDYNFQYEAQDSQSENQTQFTVPIHLNDDLSLVPLEDIEVVKYMQDEEGFHEVSLQEIEEIFLAVQTQLKGVPSLHRLLKQIDQEALEDPIEEATAHVIELNLLLQRSEKELEILKKETANES